ncbi:MAG: hypothetical protein KF696_01135 [Planctomycetes bacterium]|nr:hypothetical protein [Planctomycetota bacterium]MCW8134457.1 hypothetical protein [Planctomycetota bacterium]
MRSLRSRKTPSAPAAWLKGVGIEEAHDNAALVATAVNFWKQAEPLLRRALAGDHGVQHQEKAAQLLSTFYPEG